MGMIERRRNPLKRFAVGAVFLALSFALALAGLAYDAACALDWRFTKWRRRLRGHQVPRLTRNEDGEPNS